MKRGFTSKIVVSATAVALSALLGACSSSGGTNSPTSGGAAASGSGSGSGSAATTAASLCAGKQSVGYVDIFNSSPIETQMSNMAKGIAEKFGWKFQLVDGAGDFSKMQTGIQNFIAQKVNLIIVASSDAAPLREQLQAAKTAGIPVVEIGGGTTQSDLFTAQYAEDEKKMGSIIGEDMVKKIPNARIADLQTSLNYSGKAREEGLREAIAASGGKAKIVAAEQVDNSNVVASTTKIMTDMLTAHPDINAVFAVFDSMAASAASSLRQKGSKAKLYTNFTTPSNLDLMKKGELYGVADSNLVLTPIVAIDQFLSHTKTKAAFDPNAIEKAGGLGYRVVTDPSQTFNADKTLAPFLKRWQTEYKCS